MRVTRVKQFVIVVAIGLALAYFAKGGSAQGATDQDKPAGPPATPQQQSQEPQKPAEEVYKNIQVLKGIPANRLMGAMQFFARSLGVKCDHCHVGREFAKDDKEAKTTARMMYQMVQAGQKMIGSNKVSCYMCHRGHVEPEPVPEDVMAIVDAKIKEGEKNTKPAEQVFKNIQVLKGVPAGRIMGIMTAFTLSLGVDCNFCHVGKEFAKDDNPEKQTARKMIAMVGTFTKDFFHGEMKVNCYTCHRGDKEPVAFPPPPPPQEQKKPGN